MRKNEDKARTIDFNKAKVVSTYNDITRKFSENNDIISKLTRRLQTTLDASKIIKIFADEAATVIDFEQFVFECDGQNTIKVGDKSAPHTCLFNLTLDQTNLGSIKFSRRKRFMEEELSIIERLASTLVFPLNNAKMYHAALESALKDELTGLGNKRALHADLHREAERANRHDTPLSVILLDIDHFKHINDKHGHLAGDLVLKQFATTLQTHARQSDLCFRYGGEEFLLILDDTDQTQALKVAERLRLALQNQNFYFQDQRIPVTSSLGTSTYILGEALDNVVSRADQALYSAKNSGRNQAISYEQLSATTKTVTNSDEQQIPSVSKTA